MSRMLAPILLAAIVISGRAGAQAARLAEAYAAGIEKVNAAHAARPGSGAGAVPRPLLRLAGFASKPLAADLAAGTVRRARPAPDAPARSPYEGFPGRPWLIPGPVRKAVR